MTRLGKPSKLSAAWRSAAGSGRRGRGDRLVRALPAPTSRPLRKQAGPAAHRPRLPDRGHRGDDPPLGEGLRAALRRAAGPPDRPDGPRDDGVAGSPSEPAPDLPPLAQRLRHERDGRGDHPGGGRPDPRTCRRPPTPGGRPGAPPLAPTCSSAWPSSSGSPSRTSPPCAPRRSWSTPPAGRRSGSSSGLAARSCGSPAPRSPRRWACRRAPSWPGSSATGCPAPPSSPDRRRDVGRRRLAGRRRCPAAGPRPQLGELILARQRELGLRAADVAQLIGTTEATVSRWVNGRSRPALRNLRRLSDVLKVPYDNIIEAAGVAA